MKKLFLLTAVLLSLFACSKEDDESSVNKFSAEETEILNVLKGEWQKDDNSSPETLTFNPYRETRTVKGSVVGKEIKNTFYGEAVRRYEYLGSQEEDKMYFYVNTSKKEIHMYGVEEDGTFSIVQTKQYDYTVIDNNTLQLHDKSLSWMHEYKYNRIK